MRRVRSLFLLAIVLCVMSVCSEGWSASSLKASVKVLECNSLERVISPLLIGTNLHVGYESDIVTSPKSNQVLLYNKAANSIGFNPTMLNLCKNVPFHVLRFPGGLLSDKYHWRNGVGPTASRPIGKDDVDRAMNNFFGTMEYSNFAKELGAQMVITANYKTGTAREAANWVEFCNVAVPAKPNPAWKVGSYGGSDVAPAGYFAWLRAQFGSVEPLNVKIWEIGNEISICSDSAYLSKAAEYCKLMKEKDPTISVALCGDCIIDLFDSDLNFSSSKAAKLNIPSSVFDYLVIHFYSVLRRVEAPTIFYINHECSREFEASESGVYTISVEAYGDSALGWPTFTLLLNGSVIGAKTVNSKNKTSYVFKATLPSGKNTIAFKYDNDLVAPGVGDRNLYICGVKIKKGTKEEEVWATKDAEYEQLFGNNSTIEESIKKIQAVYPNMPIIVTEGNAGYGINTGNVDANDTRKLKAGLFVAGMMNSFIRTGVPVFNQWALYGSSMGFALALPDGHVTPNYYVMQMYSQHAGKIFVPLTVDAPTFSAPMQSTTFMGKATVGNPYLDAVASYDRQGGVLALTFVNRHAGLPIDANIDLSCFEVKENTASVQTLDALNQDGLEASNETNAGNVQIRSTQVQVGGDFGYSFKPHSLTTIRIKVASPLTAPTLHVVE